MQNIYIKLFSVIIILSAISSCKKELTTKVSGTSALTVVNGVVGSNLFYMNFNGDEPKGSLYYSNTKMLSYGNAVFFNSYTGQQKLGMYQLPDTNAGSKPVINLTLDLPVNTVHTLFLMGTAQDTDHLFTTDELPINPPADSVMSIRFVNISKGSAPVSVNISGKANGSVEADLPYKVVTAFKKYSTRSAIRNYTFEFRDKATGVVLGNCVVNGVDNDGSPNQPNILRNQNFTIALVGSTGGLAINRILVIAENVKY